MQNIETNICLPTNMEDSILNISYYEMTMDDYEEHVLHNCYGVMDCDKNDAIDYDNDEPVNNYIFELNIIDNDDSINQNFKKMHTEYKQKKVVTDNMKDHLKYSVELLELLKNGNVGNALYNKLWIGNLHVKTLMYFVLYPKWIPS